jgi:hypothetical protein
VRPRLALPLCLLIAACQPTGPALSFRLLDPDNLTDEVEHYVLKVWDQTFATCNGAAVSVMNNAGPVSTTPEIRTQSVKLTLGVGQKTFSVEGFSDKAEMTKIAQGCQTAALEKDVPANVTIRLVRVGGPPPRVVFGSNVNGFGMDAIFAVDDILNPGAPRQLGMTPATSPAADFDVTPRDVVFAGVSNMTQLFLATVDTGAETKLAASAPASGPVFAPSGKIGFVFFNVGGAVHQIKAIDRDGTNEVDVSDGASNASLPSWSRDSVQIAWIEKAPGPRLMVGGPGKTAKALAAMPTGNAAAAWRPDNTLIVPVASGGREDLVVWDVATDKLVSTVATSLTNIHSVSLSPDGNILLFASGDPGAGDVSKYDFSARKLTPLIATGSDEDWPSWSPDGTRICYTVDRKVVVAAPDGTAAKRMTSAAGGVTEVHPLFAGIQ